MKKKGETTVDVLEVAKAIIAHEAVDCFVGKEQEESADSTKLVSCTGGVFWGKPEEIWPVSSDGKPLIPWLQIACGEMKDLYGAFFKKQAVCFYIHAKFTDYEASSEFDHNDFVVREYGLGDNLAPLARPDELKGHPCHQVIWKKLLDYPSVSKYLDLFDRATYDAIFETKKFKFQNRAGIKIGGWPTPLQRDQQYPGSCDLQIDLTKNFMYGDSGIAYLSRKNNKWYVMFECC